MDILVICTAALLTSALTLFSGFGLGTLLLPVFALFFPLDISVALTAIVHLLNNIFKAALLGRHAEWRTVLRFGIPALVASYFGARLLMMLGDLKALLSYEVFGRMLSIMPIKLVIALLMIVFALMEVVPRLARLSFEKKYLSAGGALSGFFGGLSGHQGALRSAFLIKCGLGKEAYIATGVLIACMVDVTRLAVYSSHFLTEGIRENMFLVAAATASAFLGAFAGSKLMQKITMKFVQWAVAILLIAVAVGLASGVL